MLDIQVKECCRKCNHVKISQIERMARSVIDHGPVNHVRIFCEHAPVCKTYMESDEPWQGKSQT